MRFKYLLTALVLYIMIPSWNVYSQEATYIPSQQITIKNPLPGNALQGIILISADIDIEGIISADISFSYDKDPRETWFLIREISEPSPDNVTAEWDTTVITDGEYNLRIVINTEQDQYMAYVTGLRVRNYTPIETSTPTSTSLLKPAETLSPTRTMTETPIQVSLTPTPLPTNPAQLTTNDVTLGLETGAALAIGALILLGIYQFLQNKGRREE